jgi:F0F1-type ATP synthase assembly protein I
MAPKDHREEPGMDHPSNASARGRTPSGGELAGLGVFLAAVVVIPLIAGIVLDNLLRVSPLFFFLGLLIGIAGGVAVVYTSMRRYL